MHQTLDIENAGAVTRVVLCRPAVRNAHNLVMFREIEQAFAAIEADAAVARC